jgi:hypothetical protein
MYHFFQELELELELELGPDRWSVKSVSGQISDGCGCK